MANVWSSAKLLEFDFAGIEQVLMGWLMQDPQYIRIAKLGTHAIVAASALARQAPASWAPADLTWPDDQLGAYLKTIKKSSDEGVLRMYDQCKRTVHGTAYGLTTFGMVRNFPTVFPSVQIAEQTQRLYFEIAPGVPTFHTVVRHQAHRHHYLGGGSPYQYDPAALSVTGHPYGYKHWFWSVVNYQRLSEAQRLFRVKRGMDVLSINGIHYGVTLGEDAKRCVALYPQSTARGVLTEACFPLFDPEDDLAPTCYIGDLYYGQTPLRAPIHDSLLFECPTRKVDTLVERVAYAMLRPVEALACPPAWGLGSHLTIGVDAKIGDDWGHMTSLPLPSWQELGVATDVPYTPAEDEDEEDVADLEVQIGAARACGVPTVPAAAETSIPEVAPRRSRSPGGRRPAHGRVRGAFPAS